MSTSVNHGFNHDLKDQRLIIIFVSILSLYAINLGDVSLFADLPLCL